MYMKLLYERALTRRYTKKHQATPASAAGAAGKDPKPAVGGKPKPKAKSAGGAPSSKPRPPTTGGAKGASKKSDAPRRQH
jgi:hypothetical protein